MRLSKLSVTEMWCGRARMVSCSVSKNEKMKIINIYIHKNIYIV